MGRVLDFCKRAVRRVNARIAISVAVLVAAGGGAWQGYSYYKARNAGPTKQIAIGVPSSTPDAAGSQPVTASLTDGQFGQAEAGTHQLTTYGQPTESSPVASSGSEFQPPTSPYLPAASAPSGSYSVSSAEAPNPAKSPASDSIPDNPYRTAPDQSPPTSPATDLIPAADAMANYANRYGRGGSSYGTTVSDAASAQPASEPPATFPQAQAVESPPVAPPAAFPGEVSPPSAYAGASDSAGTSQRLSTSSASSSRPPTNSLPESQGVAARATATPGQRQLEGPQQPIITLEKASPTEIQVGKAASFELSIRNAGQVAAQNVVVTDHVPAGTQLLDARPQPQQASDGSLFWNIGVMQPGEETHITIQVMPQSEGEIGSTAHVSFSAFATSRSICTRPQLAIEHTAPPKVLIGESLTVGITVSNPGTGPATGVSIEEDVPEGLSHVAGGQLEYEVGTLRPGESKRLELSLRAEKAGLVQNTIHVRGDANLAAQHTVQLEVVAPQLQVEVEGPKRRFLERQATYTVQIANPGTAPARDVELAAALPRGMKFVAADSQGQYDAAQHAVFWSLAELPPAKAGAVKLTTLPVEPGEQKLRVEGRADLGLTTASEQIVQVEQAAEVLLAVKDLDEVIEVGSETTYEIRVTNKGTKAATNVRIAALMPAGMAAVSGEGPTRAGGDATQVLFEPLARLNPQEEVIYKVQVQGKQPGDHLVRVQLSSDEWPTPVTREESTRVYQDR